jgi:hypothetical protein
MEWVGAIVWVVILTLALPVALAGVLSSVALGAQGLFVTLGFAGCVLFIILDGDTWPAWVSLGMAVAALVATLVGAARLVSDDPRTMGAGPAADELAAGLAGVEMSFLLAAGGAMLLAITGVTTVG